MENKIRSVSVVSSTNNRDFDNQVNKLIQNGYEFGGEMVVTRKNDHIVVFSIMMVLK